mgnify:CR=1 FL=1
MVEMGVMCVAVQTGVVTNKRPKIFNTMHVADSAIAEVRFIVRRARARR